MYMFDADDQTANVAYLCDSDGKRIVKLRRCGRIDDSGATPEGKQRENCTTDAEWDALLALVTSAPALLRSLREVCSELAQYSPDSPSLRRAASTVFYAKQMDVL